MRATQLAEVRGQRSRRRFGSAFALLMSFAVPAVLVVAFLFLLISVRDGAEAGIASLTRLLPVGYAFAAGMVASVNPCGFFMLPSFVSYQLGAEEGVTARHGMIPRLGGALLLGAVATLGFVVVFAAIGAVIGAGGTWLVTVFPYAGLSIGIAMIGLGMWMLVTRRSIGIMAASQATVAPGRGLRNVFLFGVGYAAGSLSCTLPIFLVVVGTTFATGGLAASFANFIGYALGMGTILVAVTLGTVLFRGGVAKALRGALPHVHRASALFLLGAGAYLMWYWLVYARFLF
ncbi:MAG: cytochrome c biogenesis protein CcdA [Chloroflexi bacterium]|nr:cytochrome c biogenesis protein CcdA [Chloroflexota bacterium]